MHEFKEELDLKEGYSKAAIPEGMFSYIKEFGLISLGNGEEIGLESGENEVGLVIFSGSCDVIVDGETYGGLGHRTDVFRGLPTGVYVPIRTKCTVRSHGVKLGVCRAKCDKKSEFAVISPVDIKVMSVGRDNWQREVRMIIGANSPSVNLIVGETLNPPGNWSGTPPHKHEKLNLPDESFHEELYYFNTDKPEGFGIQRTYSAERGVDELLVVKDNTVTFMPWGYHQIVAGPGYTLYYMFFLAGAGKELAGYADPDHRWLASSK